MIDVTVQGADNLARTLTVAARQLDQAMTRANRDAGEMVAKDARGRAPRRTGTLASSITVKSGPKTAEINSGIRYAGFQEFGTRYVTPKYFLSGALGDVGDRVLDPYADAADDALSSVRGA